MKTLFWAVLMAGAATSAFAADLPTRKGTPMAPVPAYAPAFTWGGLYVGINGGYAYGGLSNTNFGNLDGGIVGGTVGYNWQMGQIVFGGEADFDYGFLKSSNNFNIGGGPGTATYKTNWMTTERLRLGYAVDRALFYVTGGYAGVSTRADISAPAFPRGTYTNSQNDWRSGGVIGGGIEYAFTNNITAKAEYLWAPLQDKTYWQATPYTETNHMSISMARVGLNYKF
jgi:outer membrane immunogenic protein